MESKLDLQYDKIKQYEQKFNEISFQKNELVLIVTRKVGFFNFSLFIFRLYQKIEVLSESNKANQSRFVKSKYI